MNALFPQYKLHHTANSDAYPVMDFLQFSKSKSGFENPLAMIVPCWLICGFFFSRDNATDAQVCSGLGSCLCGDCVCKKTGVSVMSQYKKDRAACWKMWKKNRKRYKDPVLWAWLAIFLTGMVPIRKHHITHCCLFLAQYPKRFREISHWTRKRYQNSAFYPTKYNEEITIFVLWSGRFCPCTCKILLIIAKAWLRCLHFPYKSGNVHVKYTFCVYTSAAIFFSFALVKLSTANTVNAATLIVLQTQTRTSYVAVRFTIIWRNKRR